MSVTVFSKHNCRYCKEAKSLLETKANIQIRTIFLDEQDDYEQAREEMMKLMGLSPSDPRPTLPQLFFGNQFVAGGASGLRQLQDKNLLDNMLRDIPIEHTFPPSPSSWHWKVELYDSNDF